MGDLLVGPNGRKGSCQTINGNIVQVGISVVNVLYLGEIQVVPPSLSHLTNLCPVPVVFKLLSQC